MMGIYVLVEVTHGGFALLPQQAYLTAYDAGEVRQSEGLWQVAHSAMKRIDSKDLATRRSAKRWLREHGTEVFLRATGVELA